MLAALMQPAVASCCEDAPVIELVKQQGDGRLKVAFVLTSACNVDVNYQQAVSKSDGSGNSSIMQQGDLKLVAGVPVETSAVYFPNVQSAQLNATIKLFRQQKLVAERAVEFIVRR